MKKEWNSCSWQMADGGWGAIRQKGFKTEGTFSRWKLTPVHHQSTSLTYTHMACEKPLRREADKTLIIRSRSPHSSSVLLCAFSKFYLYPSITSLPVPLSAASTIKLLCQTGGGVGGRILLASLQPSHKVLNWASIRTVGSLCHAPGKAPRGWGSC